MPAIAAALEAVADQVVPTWDQPSWDYELVMGNWQESDRVRRKILAIAARLGVSRTTARRWIAA